MIIQSKVINRILQNPSHPVVALQLNQRIGSLEKALQDKKEKNEFKGQYAARRELIIAHLARVSLAQALANLREERQVSTHNSVEAAKLHCLALADLQKYHLLRRELTATFGSDSRFRFVDDLANSFKAASRKNLSEQHYENIKTAATELFWETQLSETKLVHPSLSAESKFALKEKVWNEYCEAINLFVLSKNCLSPGNFEEKVCVFNSLIESLRVTLSFAYKNKTFLNDPTKLQSAMNFCRQGLALCNEMKCSINNLTRDEIWNTSHSLSFLTEHLIESMNHFQRVEKYLNRLSDKKSS